MKRLVALLMAAGMLACCAPAVPSPDGAGFDAIRFFNGRSRGEGVLSIVAQNPVRLSVESIGRREGPGALRLIQRIREGDKPVRQRTWLLRRAGPGRYGGALTDASGDVSVVAQGRTLRIDYAMRNGMLVTQRLIPRPGGRALDNRMTVRLLGVPIARIEERIVKLD